MKDLKQSFKVTVNTKKGIIVFCNVYGGRFTVNISSLICTAGKEILYKTASLEVKIDYMADQLIVATNGNTEVYSGLGELISLVLHLLTKQNAVNYIRDYIDFLGNKIGHIVVKSLKLKGGNVNEAMFYCFYIILPEVLRNKYDNKLHKFCASFTNICAEAFNNKIIDGHIDSRMEEYTDFRTKYRDGFYGSERYVYPIKNHYLYQAIVIPSIYQFVLSFYMLVKDYSDVAKVSNLDFKGFINKIRQLIKIYDNEPLEIEIDNVYV